MSHSERNDELLFSRIDKEVKKLSDIEKSFTKIHDSEKQTKQKMTDAILTLTNVADNEENAKLKEIFKLFKEIMIENEKIRDTKLNKLEKTIIPAVKYYPQKIKEFKNPLNRIKDYSKSMTTHHKKISSAKIKNDADTINNHEKELKQVEQEKIKTGNKLEADLVEFEAQRVTDYKLMLTHLIHSEIAYHSNALQNLTKLYQQINVIEPKENLKDLIVKYNLNSMKDYNLEEKYGFVEGETERKKQEINNEVNVNNQRMNINENKGKL